MDEAGRVCVSSHSMINYCNILPGGVFGSHASSTGPKLCSRHLHSNDLSVREDGRDNCKLR